MVQNIKPIKVRRYQCPICNRIFTDKTEATQHSNISLDTRLPKGFVFTHGKGDVYQIIGDEGVLDTGESFALWIYKPIPHTFNHSVFDYAQTEKDITGISPYFVNSKNIKEELRCGVKRILTLEEFFYFSENFDVRRIKDYEKFPIDFLVGNKFIWTTYEIDKLVKAREKYLKILNASQTKRKTI